MKIDELMNNNRLIEIAKFRIKYKKKNIYIYRMNILSPRCKYEEKNWSLPQYTYCGVQESHFC